MKRIIVVLVVLMLCGAVVGQDDVYPYDVFVECNQFNYAYLLETGIEDLYADFSAWITRVARSEESMRDPNEIADGWAIYRRWASTQFPYCYELQKLRYHGGLTILTTLSSVVFLSEKMDNSLAYIEIPEEEVMNAMEEYTNVHSAIAVDILDEISRRYGN